MTPDFLFQRHTAVTIQPQSPPASPADNRLQGLSSPRVPRAGPAPLRRPRPPRSTGQPSSHTRLPLPHPGGGRTGDRAPNPAARPGLPLGGPTAGPARPFRTPPPPRWRSRPDPPAPPPHAHPASRLTCVSIGPGGPCPAPGGPWPCPGPACPGPGGVWVWLGRVKSVNSNSEPCVSAPSSSASSVSRKVRVCELGPYASTLMAAAARRRSGASPHTRAGRASPQGARAPHYASGGIRRAHQAARA